MDDKKITPRSGPVAASITLKDRVTNDAANTREHIVSVSYTPATVSSPVTKLFLSETQSTAPSGTDTRFISLPASPTFTLQNHPDLVVGEGQVRTVYVWTSDGTTVQNTGTSSDSIILGLGPFDLSLTLRDRITGSTSVTSSQIVSLLPQVIFATRDSSISHYLFSETQSTKPAYNDGRFSASSATFSLSPGNGVKTVYVWGKDRYFVASTGSIGNITLSSISTVDKAYQYSAYIASAANILNGYLLLNPRNGSDYFTQDKCVTVSFSSPATTPTALFLSETQTTIPLASDIRFKTLQIGQSTTRFCLNTNFGRHTVYLWLKDTPSVVHTTAIVETTNFADYPVCTKIVKPLVQNTFADATSWGNSRVSGGMSADVSSNGHVLYAWTRQIGASPAQVYGLVFDRNLNKLTPITQLSTSGALVTTANHGVSIAADLSTGGWIVLYYRQIAITGTSPNRSFVLQMLFRRFDKNLVARDVSDTMLSSTAMSFGDSIVGAAIGAEVNDAPRIRTDELGRFSIFFIRFPDGALVYRRYNNDGTVSIAETVIIASPRSIRPPFGAWVHRQSGKIIATAGMTSGHAEIHRLTATGGAEGVNPIITTPSIPIIIGGSPRLLLHGRYGSDSFIISSHAEFAEYDGSGNFIYQLNAPFTQSVFYMSEPDKVNTDYRIFGIESDSVPMTMSLFDRTHPPSLLTSTSESVGTEFYFPHETVPTSPYKAWVIGYPIGGHQYEIRGHEVDLSPNNQIILSDRTDGSTTISDSNTISVSFKCVLEDTASLLSETQSTPPLPGNPGFNPTTGAGQTVFALVNTTGLHTVYSWFKDTVYNSVYTRFISLATIFIPAAGPVGGTKTFTYILKKGQNLISPALKLSPHPMRAAHFFRNTADAMLYLDSNNDPSGIFASDFTGLNPGDPAWENDSTNVRLNGGIGYEVVTAGLSTGQIRTIAFTGTAIT